MAASRDWCWGTYRLTTVSVLPGGTHGALRTRSTGSPNRTCVTGVTTLPLWKANMKLSVSLACTAVPFEVPEQWGGILTLCPGWPSRPGGPSFPGLPCEDITPVKALRETVAHRLLTLGCLPSSLPVPSREPAFSLSKNRSKKLANLGFFRGVSSLSTTLKYAT